MESGPLVLIVDDEVNMTRMLKEHLAAEGYRAAVASDALQAVTLAHELKPDIIIMDINMPAGGGLTAYERLQKSMYTQIIPVVFISGVATPEIKAQVRSMPSAVFIEKPFEMGEMIGTIRKLLGDSKDLRE